MNALLTALAVMATLGILLALILALASHRLSVYEDPRIDEVEEMALENLDHYAPELEIQFVESKEGGKAAIVSEKPALPTSGRPPAFGRSSQR